mgnify:CR=1 FL=1
MKKTDVKYSTYVQTLKEELVPAMGCTEPIALAYGAAKAREVLGCLPERVIIEASGSIIKNVKFNTIILYFDFFYVAVCPINAVKLHHMFTAFSLIIS